MPSVPGAKALETTRLLIKAIALRLILALFGISLTLIAAEISLRIVLPSAPTTNTPRDVLGPRKIGYVPFARWNVNEPEFKTVIHINSLGYRDQEIKPGVPTIVFLGDSQTFGTGVNFGERASDVVRESIDKSLTPLNVLNVAMPGASTFDERRLLVDVVKKGVNVKHVVLLVSTNDHFANSEDQDDPLEFDHVDGRPKKESAMKSWIKENRYRSRLVQFSLQRLVQLSWFQTMYSGLKADLGVGEFISLRNLYVDEREARNQIISTKQAIEHIQKIAPVTVVMVPDRYRVDPKLRTTAERELSAGLKPWQSVELDRESRLLREVSLTLGADFVDPNDDFRRQSEPHTLAYPLNGHLTVRGQRLLGDSIRKESKYIQSVVRATGE